jgi:hypothetical protein
MNLIMKKVVNNPQIMSLIRSGALVSRTSSHDYPSSRRRATLQRPLTTSQQFLRVKCIQPIPLFICRPFYSIFSRSHTVLVLYEAGNTFFAHKQMEFYYHKLIFLWDKFFFFFVCRKMEERNKAWVVGASGEVASVERQNWRSWCGVPAVERAKQRWPPLLLNQAGGSSRVAGILLPLQIA